MNRPIVPQVQRFVNFELVECKSIAGRLKAYLQRLAGQFDHVSFTQPGLVLAFAVDAEARPGMKIEDAPDAILSAVENRMFGR